MADADDDTDRTLPRMRDRFTFLLVIGATFGLQFLTLVTGVILSRMLGADGRGLIVLVLAVGGLIPQLTFGGSFPSALTKLVAERGIAARDGLRLIVRRRWWWLLIPAIAASGQMFLMRQGDAAWITVAIVFVVALQAMVFRLIAGCLQGEGRLVRMAWVALTPQLLFTVTLVVVVAAGWDWSALEVLAAYLATFTAGLVAAYVSLLKPRHRVEDELSEGEIWTEARRNYVSSVRPLDSLGLDRIILGGFLGTTSLGLYAAGTAVSSLCALVSNAIGVIVLPRVAAAHHDPDLQRSVIRRWTSIAAILILGIVVVLEVIVEPLIRIAFGTEFLGAVECARWLIVAGGLMALRGVLIGVLQGQGRGAVASWVELALVPIMVIGFVVAGVSGSLPGVGMTLAAVGLLSCIALARAISSSPNTPSGQQASRGRHARRTAERRASTAVSS